VSEVPSVLLLVDLEDPALFGLLTKDAFKQEAVLGIELVEASPDRRRPPRCAPILALC